MARLIKYLSRCYYCGKQCAPGSAFLQKAYAQNRSQWFAHCFDCYAKKKAREAKEKGEAWATST